MWQLRHRLFCRDPGAARGRRHGARGRRRGTPAPLRRYAAPAALAGNITAVCGPARRRSATGQRSLRRDPGQRRLRDRAAGPVAPAQRRRTPGRRHGHRPGRQGDVLLVATTARSAAAPCSTPQPRPSRRSRRRLPSCSKARAPGHVPMNLVRVLREGRAPCAEPYAQGFPHTERVACPVKCSDGTRAVVSPSLAPRADEPRSAVLGRQCDLNASLTVFYMPGFRPGVSTRATRSYCRRLMGSVTSRGGAWLWRGWG